MNALEKTTLELKPLAYAAIAALCGEDSDEYNAYWLLWNTPDVTFRERHKATIYWWGMWRQMTRNGAMR